METFFYVAGGILVLIALVVSAIGLRKDNFPSAGALRIGVLLVALVVGVTAFAAVELSQEESAHRLEEENIEASEEAVVTTEENAAESGGAPSSSSSDPGDGQGPGDEETEGTDQGGDTPAGDTPAGDPAAGSQVFVENGCGSCHTLADQGDQALGEIGPNLDEALVDKDTAFIETSIVDPSAEVEEGFGDGIMPDDYGSIIESGDLADLVAYLQQATSGSSK